MPATLRFRCYYCHRVHTVEDDAAGKRGRCVCGKLMLVPAPAPVHPDGALESLVPVALPPVAVPGDDGAAEDPRTVELKLESHPSGGRRAARRPEAGSGPEAVSRREHVAPLEARRTAALPSHRRREEKGTSKMSGAISIVLSFFVLAAWVIHQFFSGDQPLLGALVGPEDPNYLTFPAAFWSTLLFALFLALFLEGVSRVRRA